MKERKIVTKAWIIEDTADYDKATYHIEMMNKEREAE